ncbi:MAG: RNA-binding cell elongation regulator Jag/EloR [Spirochaetota bacterium]
MVKEFEGRTEKEAIDKAIAELGLERDAFDVEIVETSKKGILFKKGVVKIRIHVSDNGIDIEEVEPANDDERVIIEFVETCIEKMGFPGRIKIIFREEKKIGLKIDSEFSSILIGKKGKNLDALQLLANVYAGKIGFDRKVIVDAEGYRSRREETLVRLAKKVAEQVQRTRGSKLLEPMNPFERRLIHTALNDYENIDTISEGDGLYKQVRIIYREK